MKGPNAMLALKSKRNFMGWHKRVSGVIPLFPSGFPAG